MSSSHSDLTDYCKSSIKLHNKEAYINLYLSFTDYNEQEEEEARCSLNLIFQEHTLKVLHFFILKIEST